MEKCYITRPDGDRIKVVPQRGQLFVCALGCCCGKSKSGFIPVPTDFYNSEWERRRLRNKVHLTFTACLGPCSLANVALLLFEGHTLWFHSLNTQDLILGLYDYIEEMLNRSTYIDPPEHLAEHLFPGMTINIDEGNESPLSFA